MKSTDVTFEVIVRQITTTTEDDQPPRSDFKTLSSSTAGPEETAAILEALAVRVRGAKKAMAANVFWTAVRQAGQEENAKRRAAGKPTLLEEWRELLNGKPTDSKPTSGTKN